MVTGWVWLLSTRPLKRTVAKFSLKALRAKGRPLLYSYQKPMTNGTMSPRFTDSSNQFKGQILIVENEPLVREALEDILNVVGLSVISVDDGLAGVATYQERHADIDAVILDLHLAEQDGVETLRQLRAIDPAVKILVSSGYSDEEIRARLVDVFPVPTLRKPYNVEMLLNKLNQLLPH
jgi:CheY-like chemotaxis protein